MATTRKTITVYGQKNQWIKDQITAGDATYDREYIRDLLRRDQEQNSKLHALKLAIHERLDSGVSEKTVPQIMIDIEARLRADARIQA